MVIGGRGRESGLVLVLLYPALPVGLHSSVGRSHVYGHRSPIGVRYLHLVPRAVINVADPDHDVVADSRFPGLSPSPVQLTRLDDLPI